MDSARSFLLAAVLLGVQHMPAASAGSFTVVHEFNGNDGDQPNGTLIVVNGMLYGTTYEGGKKFCGVVFAINPVTGAEKVMHGFGDGQDGCGAVANLIDVDGTLYGTTVYGGDHGKGTVYMLDPGTGKETVVYSFRGNHKDGKYPEAGLINLRGTLYGTTIEGGTASRGTVFSLDPASGMETVLHSFAADGKDGTYPRAGLVEAGGVLYGTTANGGVSTCNGAFQPKGCGTVFAVTLDGNETVLHSFQKTPPDGEYPLAPLLKYNGLLYGTTWQGGSFGWGTIFSIHPQSGAETTVHSFTDKRQYGQSPEAGLMEANGRLYGTTQVGGRQGWGVVFSFDPATDREKIVSPVLDGYNTEAGVVEWEHAFYGATVWGGQSGNCRKGCGLVFKVRP